MKKKLMKRILAVVCAAAIAATQIPYGTLNTIYAAGVEEGMGDPEDPENGNVAEDPEDPENGNVAEDPETETTEAAVEPTTEAPVEMTTEAPVEITTEAGTETTTEEVNPPETPEDKTTAPVIKDITGLDGAYVDTAYVGETVTLTADITPGTDKEGNVAGYSIEWSGDVKSSSGNTAEVDTSSAGTKTVTLTVTQGEEVVTFSKSVEFVELTISSEITDPTSATAEKITDPTSATALNETHYNDKITFSVPKMDGYTYTWSDEYVENKVDVKHEFEEKEASFSYTVNKTGIDHTIKVLVSRGDKPITSKTLTFMPLDAEFAYSIPGAKIDSNEKAVDGTVLSKYYESDSPEGIYVIDKDEKDTNIEFKNVEACKYTVSGTKNTYRSDKPKEDINETFSDPDINTKYSVGTSYISEYRLTIKSEDNGNPNHTETKTYIILVRRPITIEGPTEEISKKSDGNDAIVDVNKYFKINKEDKQTWLKQDRGAKVDASNLVYEDKWPGENKKIKCKSESDSYYKITGLPEGRALLYYFGEVPDPKSLIGEITAVELDKGSQKIDLRKWDGNVKSLKNTNDEVVGTIELAEGAHFQNNYFNTAAIIQAKNGEASLSNADGSDYIFPNSTEGKNEITNVYLKTKDEIVYGPFTVIYNFDSIAPSFDGIKFKISEKDAKPFASPNANSLEKFTLDGALIVTNETITISDLKATDKDPNSSNKQVSGVNKNACGIFASTSECRTVDELLKTVKESGKTFESSVTMQADEGETAIYYVYIKLEDNAGNVNYMALDGHILSDKEPPEATITFVQDKVGQDVTLNVKLKDDAAGIKSAELHVYDGVEDNLKKYELGTDLTTIYDSKEFNDRKLGFGPKVITLKEKGAQQSILLVVTDWAGNKAYYGLKKNGENGKKFEKFGSEKEYTDGLTIDDTFNIYGDAEPKIGFEYTTEEGDKETSVVREDKFGKKHNIFIRRNGINVTFTPIPVKDVKLEFSFSKPGSNGATETLTYIFDSYDSSKHTYICKDPLITEADGEYSVALTTVADGEYSLVLTVPKLSGDKQIVVDDEIDEIAETRKEEDKTVYTDSFIKDGTAPKVKVTVDKDVAVEKKGVTEDEKTYYYGLSDGFTVEKDTNCEDITITVDVEEEYWFSQDIPAFCVLFTPDYPDMQTDDSKNPVKTVGWEDTVDKDDHHHHAFTYTIEGKADHSADGVYKINLSNEIADGKIKEKGVYINYYDYYVHNSVPDTGKKTCEYVKSEDPKYADQTCTYVIDTIRPVATYSVKQEEGEGYIEYEDDPAVYFNKAFTESFVFTEINYDEERINLKSWALNRVDQIALENEPTGDSNMTGKGKKFTETHEKQEDEKVYRYQISGTDLAGNLLIFDFDENDKNNYVTATDKDNIKANTETGSFMTQWKVLDMTAPKVTYTITALDDSTHSYVGDADYYNKEFTGFTESFTVYEVNYLESLIGFDETSLNGVVPEPVSHDTEDNHIYSVKINTEGEYQFTFSGKDKPVGTDKAGNPIVITKSTGTTGNDPENGTGSYTTGKKIYDVTEPTFKVTDMTQPAGFANVDGTTAYFSAKDLVDGAVSTTFEVTDSYLDVKKVETNVAYKVGDNYASLTPDWNDIKLPTTAENGNGPETKITLTAKSTDSEESKGYDGVYRFEIAGEDRAGNKLAWVTDSDYKNGEGVVKEYNKTEQHASGEYWTYNKIIDTKAPTGTITIGSYYDAELAPEAVLSVNNSEPYRSETSASGTVSAVDNSPVHISYPITSTVSGTRGMETGYGYNPKSGFEMNGQQVFYLEITLTDRAGNVTGPIKTNSIYLDVEAPTVDQLAPTIQIVANANSSAHGPEGNPLFNSSVPFLIVVTDPNATAQSSGLDEITYEILVDGIVATTGTLKGKDALKFPAVGSKTYTDPTLDYSLTYNNNEVVADSSLNSNNIMIRVHASDHAQNKSQREYNFGIDIVSPTISVTYDNNDVQNERYFKADRTATIVVTERNFDPSRINVSTNGGSQSGWSFSNNGGNGDNDTWTSTVTYSSDGDYTFSVAGSDILGHEATDISYGGTAPQSFTVDKTVPVITISFDHTSGYQNSKYYNQTRTGTVQIQEHNFRSSDAKVSAPGTISRGDQPTASMGGWGDSGDSHSMNITFDQDGDYSISAEYTDLAGNPAVPVKSEDFTIDKTAPVIEFDKASVTDKKAYSGVIAPRLLFSDTNYDPNGVTFTLTGIKNSKGKDLRLTEVFNDETGYGGSISYENFANIKANDDIYTARGTITDRAGNTSEVSITFSVNRFGSTWDYNNDKTTEGLLFKYTNQEKNVFLREINPDEVTVQSVVLTHDSEIRNLEEGKDYKVTANTSEGWKEYVYEFLAENFENEGTYSIVVQTQDEANNINTNSSVKRDGGSDSVPLQYSVDKTNPYATLDGVDLEEKRYSQDSLPLFTRLFDNLSGVYKVEIFIYPTNSDDDDPARMTPKYAYENTEERAELEEILQANNGEVPFEIGANNTPQDVRIVTYDAAGNISETVLTSGETFAGEVLWEGVLVTRNIASQYFYNRPLFFGSLGALGAGGIFLFLFLKRRKKDEDKENAA